VSKEPYWPNRGVGDLRKTVRDLDLIDTNLVEGHYPTTTSSGDEASRLWRKEVGLVRSWRRVPITQLGPQVIGLGIGKYLRLSARRVNCASIAS
jgi:hypothetical protein